MFTGVPADRASNQAELVRSSLVGTRFRRVRWVASTGSTNSDAMALARDGAPEGTVVVADHQTAGRGRRGRTWTAPAGASLLVSVLLRPPAPLVGGVGMAVGLAMAEAVEELTGVDARLKWPNDLLVADRKLAGILAEADWPAGSTASGGYRPPRPTDRAAVVAGVGINVNWPAELPDDLAATAAALNHLVDGPVDRAALLIGFLRRLDARYGALVAAGAPAALLADWRDRSATLGRRVRVDLGTEDVDGLAVDVTGEGHLVVETADGQRRTFAVGDVVHLRPH